MAELTPEERKVVAHVEALFEELKDPDSQASRRFNEEFEKQEARREKLIKQMRDAERIRPEVWETVINI